MTTTKTRTRISAGLLALASLAGVAVAATPASAIEPDSPEGAIVLPNSASGEINAQLRGFCHMKMGNDPLQTEFAVVKTDQDGEPIPGVEFTVDFDPNAHSTHAISLDSWEAVRSPELEQARVDAEHAVFEADTATNDYRASTYYPAENALKDANDDLSYAQFVLASGSTPEREAAVVTAQSAVDAAQADFDAVVPGHDAVVQAATDARAVAVAAAQAISDHLMSEAEIDDWTIVTDENGVATLSAYYCAGAGEADSWTFTETSVPEGISPARIGAELIVTTGYQGQLAGVTSGLGEVYKAAGYVGQGTYNGAWTINAENERLPEPTPTPTPEEPMPTPTPEEPTPTPTPVKEVKVTPAAPAMPPIVSG